MLEKRVVVPCVLVVVHLTIVLHLNSSAVRENLKNWFHPATRETNETSSSVRREKLCIPRKYIDFPYNATFLASFPGSGNTWVRYLLQQASGYHTGSVYNSKLLRENGFPGEGRSDNTVLVIKTHGGRLRRKPLRALLLLRDAADAIAAEFKRKKADKTHDIDQALYQTQEFEQFVLEQLILYREFLNSWFERTSEGPLPLLVVHYEDLAKNMSGPLGNIIKNLTGRTVSEQVMDCVKKNSEGSFHRVKEKKVDPFQDRWTSRFNNLDGYSKDALERCIQRKHCIVM